MLLFLQGEDSSDVSKKKKAKSTDNPAAKAKPPAYKPKAVTTTIAMTGLAGSINTAVAPAKVHMPV